MTTLSIFLHARRPGSRTAPLTAPGWPVVVLALALWGAACCSGASAVPKNSPPAPAVLTAADWLGRSREDVVEAMGKPLSALQRGDTEILMYAKDVRFEIRGGEVVAYRAGSGPAIIASDGTGYHATDRGKVARVVPPPQEATDPDEDEDVAAVPATPTTPVTNPAPKPAEAVAAVPAEPVDLAEAETGTWMGHTSEMPDGTMHPMAEAAGKLTARGLMPMGKEPKNRPAWVRPTREIVGALLRFGFALLIIRIAISVAELPCYLPDVVKVSALFVIIREGVHALVNLGGNWEWIRLFMIDDIVSYFALMILLFRFKVALSGISAVKIATATISVNYFVMLMVGVVLSFMIG